MNMVKLNKETQGVKNVISTVKRLAKDGTHDEVEFTLLRGVEELLRNPLVTITNPVCCCVEQKALLDTDFVLHVFKNPEEEVVYDFRDLEGNMVVQLWFTKELYGEFSNMSGEVYRVIKSSFVNVETPKSVEESDKFFNKLFGRTMKLKQKEKLEKELAEEATPAQA